MTRMEHKGDLVKVSRGLFALPVGASEVSERPIPFGQSDCSDTVTQGPLSE